MRPSVQAAAAAAGAFSVLSAAKSESDSADPTPASVVGQTRLKRTLSDSKGAPTVTAPSEADGAQAKAAAAVAASLATLQQAQMAKGVSKEHMDEIVSDLRGLPRRLCIFVFVYVCPLPSANLMEKGEYLAKYPDVNTQMCNMVQRLSESSKPKLSPRKRRSRP